MSIKLTLVITDTVTIHLHNDGITLCPLVAMQFLDITIFLPAVACKFSAKLGLMCFTCTISI